MNNIYKVTKIYALVGTQQVSFLKKQDRKHIYSDYIRVSIHDVMIKYIHLLKLVKSLFLKKQGMKNIYSGYIRINIHKVIEIHTFV